MMIMPTTTTTMREGKREKPFGIKVISSDAHQSLSPYLCVCRRERVSPKSLEYIIRIVVAAIVIPTVVVISRQSFQINKVENRNDEMKV